MPLKPQPSKQLITLKEARDVISKLTGKGVPVDNLREISDAYGTVAVDGNPDYVDDGGKYQYIASVWNKDMELGLIGVSMANVSDPWTFFFQLAQDAVTFASSPGGAATVLAAYPLVLNLNGVRDAINAQLKL